MTDDIQVARINQKIDEAAALKEMCNTPGFKILQAKFEEKIKKATVLILDMTTPEEKVKDLRQKIHVWTEITSLLKALILTGNYAARLLRDTDLDENTPAE